MSNPFSYPVKLETDDDGRVVATFPDLPYGATDGATEVDALDNASDMLDEVVAGLMNANEAIPEPSSKKRGQVMVSLSAQMAAKAALYDARRASGMSNVALAKAMGCDEKEVRRMMDPHHPTKLPRIEDALRVLGRRLVVTLAPPDDPPRRVVRQH